MSVKVDTIQVFPYRRKVKGRGRKAVVVGWRFRMLKVGAPEAILTSNGLYPDSAAATAVAEMFNRLMYRGQYKVKLVRQ